MRSWKGIEILKNRIAFIIVLGIVIIMLFPIIWMVTTSFKNSVDSMSIPPKWFFQPTAENYESILKNQDFNWSLNKKNRVNKNCGSKNFSLYQRGNL
jgi:ABC-type glycerol-3-phosphate transport system permease component